MFTQKSLARLALAACLISPLSVHAFGAIAVDDEQGESEPGYGLVTGYDSRKAAEAAALSECRDAGNTSCKVMLWFKTCGAYAANRTYYGVGFGESLKLAESKAVAECGQGDCRVVVSDCE